MRLKNCIAEDKEKAVRIERPQITDKGFRTKVLSPLSYFTGFEKYGII